MKKTLKKDLNCPYSLIDREYICEHKTAGLKQTNTKYLHNHDGYEIVLFLRGEVNIMIEPEIFKMKRGDMFFISPLVFHGLDLQDSSNYERIVINLQYEYLKKLGDDETDFSTLFQSAASPYMNHFVIPEDALPDFIETAERLHDCMDSTAFGHAALAKALIIELMLKANGYSSAERPQNKSSLIPPLVSKIFDYIESNINDDLKISKMARDLHYSSDHLSRVFSEVTGDSLKHYINAKKMVLAQKILLQNYSPSDVCFMLGYNNYSSFSRRFSKQIGTSPKQFQLSHRTSGD